MTTTQGPENSVNAHILSKLSPPLCEFEPVFTQAAARLLRAPVLMRLTVLCAPPGYGKTVLMSSLYRQQVHSGMRCLWLTLDDRDSSITALISLFERALCVDQHSPPTPPIPPLVTDMDTLRFRLSLVNEPITVFIDNLQYCTDPQLSAWLDLLVFAGPLNLHLVLSSVTDIPLDLVRAKLELGVVQLKVEHFAFNHDCSARLFELASIDTSPDGMLNRIQQRTEGWPAALRLLAVLMRQHDDPEGVLAQFSGEDVDISAVLTRRVLAGFDPSLVEFLREIALLREFCVDLAQQATGRVQAQQWIELLLTRNVLIFPLDHGHRWLRLHTLLRQHLLADDKGVLSTARRKHVLEQAAHWHANQGDKVNAIELAMEASSFQLAQDWLEQTATQIVADQGQLPLFVRWVDSLTAAGMVLSIELQAWHVWALCFTLQYERARRTIDMLDIRVSTFPPHDLDASLRQRISLQRAVVETHLDALPQALAEAKRWLDRDDGRNAYDTCIASGCAAVAELASGNPMAAQRHMRLSESTIERTESLYGRSLVAAVTGSILLAQGNPLEAERQLGEARTRLVGALGMDSDAVRTMDFVYSRALLDLDRVEAARGFALRGLDSAARHGVIDCVAPGLATCVALWKPDDAALSPARLDAVARSYPPRMRRLLTAYRVRRLLRLDLRDEAREQATEGGLLSNPFPGSDVSESGDVFLARADLLAASGRPHEALDIAAKHIRLAMAAGRHRELVEWYLLGASVHARNDRDRDAVRQLALAITKAARYGLLWPFREHAATVNAILSKARTKDFGFIHSGELALLAHLSPGTEIPSLQSGSTTTATAAEHLTTREMQLLELLGLGLDNRQIADRAGMSVPTVKWHLSNCYAKLDVRSRIAALAKARALGLFR